MSATYRIEATRDPHSTLYPWDAAIWRLSDGMYVRGVYGGTREEAISNARQWIANENACTDEQTTLHVDDQGRDAEAPQSVKV